MIVDQIPVILVTYNASSNLAERLEHLSKKFELIILVDNGSDAETISVIEKHVRSMKDKLLFIPNRKNLGVAKALNQGLSLANQLGYQFAVTLDQDSEPLPDMLEKLTQAFLNHPNNENLAVLAPDIIEKNSHKKTQYLGFPSRFSFKRMACHNEILRNVTFVITSGSLYNLQLYLQIGPFRDDFFVDAVDMEYCLRAVSKGYEISVACNAKLEHNLGHRVQRRLFGWVASPTFHPPSRWYFMNRNRIAMYRLYALRFPNWLFHETGVAIKGLIRMLVFENHRIIKIKAMFYGIRDGILNRMGEMPPNVEQALTIRE